MTPDIRLYLTMNIVPATRSDIPTLIRFQQQMAHETEDLALNEETLAKGISAVFDHPPRGAYFKAIIEGKIAGCLMITYEWSEWRNASIIWIQSVYVEKEFRRQGVYSALYQHIKDIVDRQPGAFQGIRLYVEKNNRPAQHVYESLGMTEEHYLLYEWLK